QSLARSSSADAEGVASLSTSPPDDSAQAGSVPARLRHSSRFVVSLSSSHARHARSLSRAELHAPASPSEHFGLRLSACTQGLSDKVSLRSISRTIFSPVGVLSPPLTASSCRMVSAEEGVIEHARQMFIIKSFSALSTCACFPAACRHSPETGNRIGFPHARSIRSRRTCCGLGGGGA